MTYHIIRPNISDEKWEKLESYLRDYWKRAQDARNEHVDRRYPDWLKNYDGVPAQKVRSLPWYQSSNVVIPIARIFIDTFVARTLNTVFATKPLFLVSGFPSDQARAFEEYLNYKAVHEWGFYNLSRSMLFRGNKYGTATTKVTWLEDMSDNPYAGSAGDPKSEPYHRYFGPKPQITPFDDWYGYPHRANTLDELDIQFHRLRFSEAKALRLREENKWKVAPEDFATAMERPLDAKRDEEETDAGIGDQHYRELQVVEAFLEYDAAEDGRHMPIVAVFFALTGKLVDVYFDPCPPGAASFHDYRPIPKEDLIYGTSMVKILSPFQEEISQIHNERRNNNYLASAPIFKTKQGARVPNASTTWYPGKNFVLENMDDFEVVSVGRIQLETLQEESHDLMLAERLMGITAAQQGFSQGTPGKGRGTYNTGGTMAMLTESNTRGMTNVRDFRQVISGIGKTCMILERQYGRKAKDPVLEQFSPEKRELILAAIEGHTVERVRRKITLNLATQASEAAMNRETRRLNLLQAANVVQQYGQQTLGLTKQLATMENPLMKTLIERLLAMQHEMAQSVVSAFELDNLEEKIPDVGKIKQQLSAQSRRAGPPGGAAGQPGLAPAAAIPGPR